MLRHPLLVRACAPPSLLCDFFIYLPLAIDCTFVHVRARCGVARMTDQAALDAPRVCLDADGSVALEEGIAPEVVSELERRGHRVVVVLGHARAQFGRGQVILVRHESPVGTGDDGADDDDDDYDGATADGGVVSAAVPKTMRVLIGGSDGRADGCAMASSS
jgi:hypothetical protein